MVRRKQSGFSIPAIMVGVIVFSYIVLTLSRMAIEAQLTDSIELQGQRLATISNAVIRYQSSAEDLGATPPILAPEDQFDQTGQPFFDGTVHTGLDWLKPASCGGEAPIELLNCNYPDLPILSDNGIYRFTIDNDGTRIYTTISIVQADDETQGMVIRGELDDGVAVGIAVQAESMTTFTSVGAANTFFTVEGNSIVTAQIGVDLTNNPYVRKSGDIVTGDLDFKNGAAINSASNVTSSRFSGYDSTTDSSSTTRYVDPLGDSFLENLEAVNMTVTNTLDATTATIDSLSAEQAETTSLETEYLRQTNPNVQSSFAGEVQVGAGTDRTIINNGDIYTSGVLANADDPSRFVDPSGVSVMNDIALGALGGALLSDLTRYPLVGSVMVSYGQSIPMPNCGSGAEPKLMLINQRRTTMFLDNGEPRANNNINYVYADISGNTWLPQFKTHDIRDPSFPLIDDVNGMALAQIYCRFN